MRSTIKELSLLILFASISLFCTSALADGPDFNYAVTLRINGQIVNGALETSNQIRSDPVQEDSILSQNIFPLVRNSTAQLDVKITTGSDTVDYTGSSRLKYDSVGCLTVSDSGFMTVTPSGNCSSIDKAMLMIFFFDANGNGITYNYFLFSVQ